MSAAKALGWHSHPAGIKFGNGNGNVTAIDGNKINIAFDKAGETRVVDSFVDRV